MHAWRAAASRRRTSGCWQAFGIGDEFAVADWVVIDGELEEAVKQ